MEGLPKGPLFEGRFQMLPIGCRPKRPLLGDRFPEVVDGRPSQGPPLGAVSKCYRLDAAPKGRYWETVSQRSPMGDHPKEAAAGGRFPEAADWRPSQGAAI
jgi:hypothetical protein